ncbi:hypothetical protein N7533_010441 [Penicillium manginii]|uniref:uncharacterized protein n=1 Tax=Penicillium manginii TaxID=203109 RepID=UPI0025478AD0|nr:uncharacterized protein N7533_010441 [Penicillium manginii]KAJ5743339.1 hypothetical protein N7533_010441 [Penicillium manginii]
MIQPNSQLLITESELERALDGDSSPRSIAPQYDELTKYLQSAVAAGKRPAVTSGDEEDSDADGFVNPEENLLLSFPNTQHRVSGRIRKKSRLLDGYIV